MIRRESVAPSPFLPREAARLPGPIVALLAAATLLAACGKGDQLSAGGSQAAPPPPSVGVVTVQSESVSLQTELPGRVEPLRVAQVRARANGVVLKRLFREGSDVKAGQALFQIDAAPYRAALDSAAASVARAQANLTQATAQAKRFKPLLDANAISQQDYVDAQAAQKQAEADVAAGKAAMQTARINLDYAHVTAPISGRIGRALVTEGALASAAEATQLATIQQIDRVYVNITQSVNEVQQLRRAIAARTVSAAGPADAQVTIVLDDGTRLPQTGKLLFSDLTVDATTGQVTLRAEVPNADGLLLPGQYVRARLVQAELPNGILLPQQAVTRASTGDTVLVIGADSKPVPRQVKIRGGQNGQWIVTEGLQAGEQVIADGFQKMMVPGAPVTPVPWAPAGSTPAAAGGAAPAGAAPAPAASAASAR